MRNLVLSMILTVGVLGCSKNGAQSVAMNGSNQVGCQSFTDSFYDSIYGGITADGRMPSLADYESSVKKALKDNQKLHLNESDKDLLASRLSDLYKTLSVDAVASLGTRDRQSVLSQLTSLELGDRTTGEKKALQETIKSQIQSIQSLAQTANSGCANPVFGSIGNVSGGYLANMQASLPPAVFGAWKTIATAYQSCSVLSMPPLDESVPDAQGVAVTGSSGGGLVRAISNLSALDSTDPYLEGRQSTGSSCFNVSAQPLIYNYGGKPNVTSDAIPRFDFFTNSGTGQNTLGVDCSGFVYSAYAVAGLKMKRETTLKAVDVYGISSDMLFDPQSNGLTCLDRLSYSAPVALEPGDLIVQQGHVVMVDHVGSDPFGIGNIDSAAGCTPANMNPANFDFAVSQSSPVKAGVGIDRYKAADYFGHQNSTMEAGLQAYAASLCQARFGVSPQYTSSTVSIVRHASDSQCLGQAVPIKNEECLNSCPATPPGA